LAYLMLCTILLISACAGKEQGAGNVAPEDGNKGAAEQKTVTVAVMTADPWLMTATRKFEELHKDIHIEIKEYRAMPQGGDGMAMPAMTEGDMEKFVQTVTAQALSGDASDLIEMSNLPQDKFIEKQVLVDLNDLIGKDASFDKKQYYENILQTSQLGEGLYSIPFSFYLDRVIKANASLLNEANIAIDDNTWTWDQMKDIVKKLRSQTGSDAPTFSMMPPAQMLYDYISANYSKLVGQGSLNFDTDSFRDTMRQIKAMYDEGIMSTEYIMDESKGLFALHGLVEPASAMTDLLRPNTVFLQMPSFDGKPGGFGYRTLQMFGINSKSKVQPEAWEFLKFLLSEEMQASPELGGYPVHKSALDKKLEEVRQMIERGEIPVPEGQPGPETLQQITQQLEQILDNVQPKAPADFKVSAIAIEEFQSYMSGQKSAEEVSKLIQNRVSTYLNE